MIFERKSEEWVRDARLVEAQTRTLASFIAGGPGKENIRNARRIQFVKDRKVDLPSTEQIEQMLGGPGA